MKILLADDHTLFRDALVEYMRRADDSNEILIAGDYYEARKVLEQHHDIDLTLLDFKMPGMNGLEGLKLIKEAYPDIPVALISGIAEERHVKKAMEIGAHGFFPKTLSGKALMKAIDLVLMGEKFLPVDHVKNSIQPSYYHGENESGFRDGGQAHFMAGDDPGLTRREMEVMGYLAQGASNKDIARALDLQIVTIKLHVRGICKKLGAKNRTQAVLTAQRIGLVES